MTIYLFRLASCLVHGFVNIVSSFFRKSDPVNFSFSTGTYCHFFLLGVDETVLVFRSHVDGKSSIETPPGSPSTFLVKFDRLNEHVILLYCEFLFLMCLIFSLLILFFYCSSFCFLSGMGTFGKSSLYLKPSLV